MRNIVIGLMRVDDVSQVCAIEKATFTDPWSRASIEHEITSNDLARYLVAKDGDIVVGYAGMWLVLDEAHITNVAVKSDCRGQGIGKKIMVNLIQLAADSGANWMTLEVRRTNNVAQSLYRKLGFIDVGVRKGYYADNKEDAILMALEKLPEGNPENDPYIVYE